MLFSLRLQLTLRLWHFFVPDISPVFNLHLLSHARTALHLQREGQRGNFLCLGCQSSFSSGVEVLRALSFVPFPWGLTHHLHDTHSSCGPGFVRITSVHFQLAGVFNVASCNSNGIVRGTCTHSWLVASQFLFLITKPEDFYIPLRIFLRKISFIKHKTTEKFNIKGAVLFFFLNIWF